MQKHPQDGERLYISHIEATEQRGIGDPINDIERAVLEFTDPIPRTCTVALAPG